MKYAEKRELILEGLDCASCAAKIETKVKEIEGVKNASVNFVTKKLTLELNNGPKPEDIVKKASMAAKSIESDIEVFEQEEKKTGQKSVLNKSEVIVLSIGILLYGTAFIIRFPFWVEFTLFFTSYLLIGKDVLIKAVRNIFKGQLLDENFLMFIATIGAFSLGEFSEGAAVMLFYKVGELLQDMAVNRSRKSIAELMNIRPDYANLKSGESLKRVSPEEVDIGSVIVVKPGERIPLDGRIIEGRSMVDVSALTGESVPKDVKTGDEVLSGSINKSGVLNIEVTKKYSDSTVSKILDLVQNASSQKAPTENYITKFAQVYTPIVVFASAALAIIPPLVIPGAVFSEWLYRSLVFLVISCPCALVISIPLGYFGGIGAASRHGILVKGSNYLEALNSVNTVVFDKTGTLTKGIFEVTELNPSNGFSKEHLLEYAAAAERFSNHPIALSIIKAFGKSWGSGEIESFEEIPGQGIKTIYQGKGILAGNETLMNNAGIKISDTNGFGTTIHVAVDGKYAGNILISDEIKPDSKKALEELKKISVKKLIMLTGDNNNQAQKIGRQLGLDEVYAQLLPHQKVEKIEIIAGQKARGDKLAFVGDGINDAPVLARSDIGVAMGGLGSDAAIEAADIVLMTDEPSKLVSAIKIARKTKKIIWQNIILAFAVKIIVLALGTRGMATMWEAVFADVGVAVLAVLNAMRLIRVKKL
ncbi:MAG: cadmium-translocating P-type ATPase [Clostridium sp.]|jgi:Cd2+/Zn2+-exporting ATPase|nr:cadmium-translocating P-type ATPase [Clostridium sp.]